MEKRIPGTFASSRCTTYDLTRLPSEFAVVLLIFALILAASPYLSGTDLGIFKIPDLEQGAKNVLRILGPLIFVGVVVLFIPMWKLGKKNDHVQAAVESHSKYRLQSIADIVKGEATNNGINIDGLAFGDDFTVNDLELFCYKTYCPTWPRDRIRGLLRRARAKAFSIKYAEPKEDEKLESVLRVKLPGLKPWQEYFAQLLKDLHVDDLNAIDVLDVGIGNGYADCLMLKQLNRFIGVDASADALEYARKKLPQMISYVSDAEDLDAIANASVDLYLSFRIFQSSLFDRRAALHEAYRVLRPGGLIILSIPIMFLKDDGSVLSGLIPPGSVQPEMGYAREIVERVRHLLKTLNFKEVGTDDRSPFEVYVYAHR